MKKPGFIRRLAIVLGLMALIVTGYGATSVVTSCDAEAQCVCSICVYVAQGLMSVLAQIAGAIIVPAIAAAASFVIAYLGLAFLAFTEQVVEKFWTVAWNFTSWFDAFYSYNLVPAMQQQTRQLNTADVDQSRAWSGFADSDDLNRTRKEIYDIESQSASDYKPGENACVAGTITGGMTRASTFQRAYNAAAPVEMLPRSGNALGTPAASGRAADQAARWNEYTTRYCDPTENGGAAGCTAAAPRPDYDLDVTGQLFQKDTIDMTDAETKRTVDDLIINIAEPFVKDSVPASAVESATGQQRILEGEAYKAKRQTIYDALYYVVSRRVPGSNMRSFLEPMRSATGVNNADISANPSKNEVMEVMMSERFKTGKYSIEQIDEPVNNDRELVIQQAFQVMQLSDQLDLLDRYSLVLAAQVGPEIQEAKPFSAEYEQAPVK